MVFFICRRPHFPYPLLPPATSYLSPATRAEKHPNSCAEGAPRRFRAEKGIISCAERDTTRLPSRKTPQFPRRRCSKAVPGRKRYHFRRRTEYHPPPEQKNTPIPAQKIANILHKCLQHHYFSVFGNFAFLKKNSQDKFTRSLH